MYGDGQNVRDWLFVEDHCAAIRRTLARGQAGETYNIGGGSEKRNIEIVEAICSILDQACPNDPRVPHRQLITFVKDRPATTVAMPLMDAKSNANWIGHPARVLKAAFARPSSGTCKMKSGSKT